MNKYKTGQTLISKENQNDKRKVLGVCDLVVFIDEVECYGRIAGVYTEKYLDEHYTIEKVDWKPVNKGEYWYITDCGGVEDMTWENDNVDQFRLKQKNVFETREDAEERLSELNK